MPSLDVDFYADDDERVRYIDVFHTDSGGTPTTATKQHDLGSEKTASGSVQVPLTAAQAPAGRTFGVKARNAVGSSGISGTKTVPGGAAPPPDPTPKTWTDFSEYAVGDPPNGWTDVWDPGASWTVEADGAAQVLEVTTAAAERYLLRWEQAPESEIQEVLYLSARTGFSGSFANHSMAALRASGDGSSERGYWFMVRSFDTATSSARVGRSVNASFSQIAIVDLGFFVAPDDLIWVRARVEGTAIKIRVWRNGDPEPAAWTISETNADIATGRLGIMANSPLTTTYKAFGYAVGGGTARVS